MTARILRTAAECLLMLLLFVTAAFLLYEFYFADAYHRAHIFYRYTSYMKDLLSLDFGTRSDGVQVSFFIVPALFNSLVLLLPPIILAVITAYIAAGRQFITGGDISFRLFHGASRVITSVPVYWLGFILLGISMTTRWFPIGGVSTPGFEDLNAAGKLLNRLHHLALPYLCMYLFPAVLITSMVQDRVKELSGSPYVLTAMSQGLTRRQVFSAALSRPAWAEALLQAGASMPVYITMMVIVERVFLYPGLGTLAVEPYGRVSFISTVDSRTAQAAVLCIGICSILLQYLFRIAVPLLVPEGGAPAAQKNTPFRQNHRLHFILALMLLPLVSLLPGSSQLLQVSPHAAASAALLLGAAGMLLLVRKREAPSFSHAVREVPVEPAEEQHPAESFSSAGRRRPDAVMVLCVLVFLLIAVGSWLVPEQTASAPPIRRPSAPLSWWESLWAPGSIIGRSLLSGRFLVIPAAASVIGGILGAAAGTASGMTRGAAGDGTVRLLEVFPSILIYIFISSLFDGHPWAMLLPFGIIAFIRMFRLIRFSVVRIMDHEYIQYAKLLGCGFRTLLLRHLIPNLRRRFGVNLAETCIDMIILEVNLSFIGRLFRVEGAIAEHIPILGWAPLFREARYYFIRSQWDQVFIPALVFSAVILSLRIAVSRLNRRKGL